MLAADKLLLQANIKQNAVQLREKELKLHYENFNAVGTQAAVLAGFAMTALAEVTVPPSCEQVQCRMHAPCEAQLTFALPLPTVPAVARDQCHAPDDNGQVREHGRALMCCAAVLQLRWLGRSLVQNVSGSH